MSLVLIIGLAILAGIGFLLLRETKKNGLGPGATVMKQDEGIVIPGAGVLLPGMSTGKGTFDEDSVTSQLMSVGFSEDDIDDFYDWLYQKPRSSTEIYSWLQGHVNTFSV